mgnify:FL=1
MKFVDGPGRSGLKFWRGQGWCTFYLIDGTSVRLRIREVHDQPDGSVKLVGDVAEHEFILDPGYFANPNQEKT